MAEMEVETIYPEDKSVKIKLIKGQRGAYGWEITVNHPGIDEGIVMDKVNTINKQLLKDYGI